MSPLLVLFLIFLVALAAFFTKRRMEYVQEARYWFKKKKYDKALLAAQKAGDWFLVERCLEEIENSFSNASIEEVCRNMNAMLKTGNSRRAKRVLNNRARLKSENERLLLIDEYWDKLGAQENKEENREEVF